MTRSISLVFVSVVFAVSVLSNYANAQTDFFWSTQPLGAGASNSFLVEDVSPDEEISLYLYYSTQNSELATGGGLDISFTIPNGFQFVYGETFNFDIVRTDDPSQVVDQRWLFFGQADSVQADAICGLNAFVPVGFPGTGIVNANDGSGEFLDLGYDPDADAFLFARIDLVPSNELVNFLEIEIGSLGLFNDIKDGRLRNPSFGQALLINVGAQPICAGPGGGDVNFDGSTNLLDVAPFVAILQSNVFLAEADINGDGGIDLLDVAPFVEILTGS